MTYCDYKDGQWYNYPEYTPNRQTSYKVYRNGETPEQAQLVGWNDGKWQRLFRNEAGDLQLEDYKNVTAWQYYEVKLRVW